MCRWHDAGTYDAKTKTGGPNGSIRNEEEYTHGANSGLKKAVDFCGMFISFVYEFVIDLLFIVNIYLRIGESILHIKQTQVNLDL